MTVFIAHLNQRSLIYQVHSCSRMLSDEHKILKILNLGRIVKKAERKQSSVTERSSMKNCILQWCNSIFRSNSWPLTLLFIGLLLVLHICEGFPTGYLFCFQPTHYVGILI